MVILYLRDGFYVQSAGKNIMKSRLINLLFVFFVSGTTSFLYTLGIHIHQVNNISATFAYLWIIPFPLGLVSLIGIIYHGFPKVPSTTQPRPIGSLVFRVVTRGKNIEAVTETISHLDNVITQFILHYDFPQFAIEVVSDNELDIPSTITPTQLIVVPQEYQTLHHAKYKARALQYALEVSSATDEDYIIHLDEETQVNEQTILGIIEFIASHPNKVIGQGVIEYSRTLRSYPLQTLADSIRVADDLGRFRLSFKLGKCFFGMKGSFVIIKSSDEKQIGFDIGPSNSITEDAYFALKAMQLGYKFSFINGFMHEQSPFTLHDFIKQRQRWFKGIWLVLQDKDLSLKTRLALTQSFLLWMLSPLVLVATLTNMLYPSYINPIVRLLGTFTFACYIFFYLYGYIISHIYNQKKKDYKRVIIYGILQIVGIPLFSLMETVSVVGALLSRDQGFYVVKK